VRTEHLEGIAYISFGVLSFAVMDAAGKWIVRDASVFQLLGLRSTLALMLLLGVAPFIGGRRAFTTRQPAAHLARALVSVVAFLCFFASVRVLPLADAVAIEFGGPFIVTALSVPMLGERVDGRRWAAVAVGFLGMLLIVRPSGRGIRPAALLVVASSFSYALMMVSTRWMTGRSPGGEKTFVFLFYTFLMQAVVGLGVAALSWTPMSLQDFGLSIAVGVLALGGHFGVTRAFQRAPGSVVAPFEYTALVWAVVTGYLVFGDFPEPTVWLGVAVIIAAGLYTVYRD
jgi:drug/metabolite transporter (DMT)-like permease